MLNILVFLTMSLLGCTFFVWGIRFAFKVIQQCMLDNILKTKKKQLIGGNADEFLRLEGEIRAYERILKQGPTACIKQLNSKG